MQITQLDEANYNRVFVHFQDEITNFGLASEVISQIPRYKDRPGAFYSSRYLYEKVEIFDRKNLVDDPFGIYLDNLNLAIINIQLEEQLKELEEHPAVASIYPDIMVTKSDLVREPYVESNWGVDKLNLADTIRDGSGVNVAVLDSGIDLTHPNYQYLDGKQNNQHNIVSPTRSVQDFYGHGTHVAGIIAGKPKGNLKYGVAPKVNLFIGKVTGNSGQFFSKTDIVNGIDWALEKHCKIINLSGGFRVFNGKVHPSLQKAVTAAYQKKAIVVAAVGNDSIRTNTPPDTRPVEGPANCLNAVAVSAINDKDEIYKWANQQKFPFQEIDFIAPGVGIFSTFPIDIDSRGFSVLSGTSMATPFISGMLALYYQNNLDKDPDEIINLLKQSLSRIRLDFQDAGNGMPIFNEPTIT